MPGSSTSPPSKKTAGAARVVAVGGGKGGVGKSVVATNLAVALAELGQDVVLVDVDFGAANAHTLLGVDRPGAGLGAVLSGDGTSIGSILVDTGVRGLRLAAGIGAVPGSANFNHGQKQRLLREIRSITADVVVLDVGAGISFNSVDFFLLADVHLVVLTPQMTSIQNAYSFLKAAVHRQIRRSIMAGSSAQGLADELAAAETEAVSHWLRRTAVDDPEAGERARAGLSGLAVRLVGNSLFDDKDRAVVDAVARMFQDYLCLSLEVWSRLKASRRLHDSVTNRRPALLDPAQDDNTRALRALAANVLALDVAQLRERRALALAQASTKTSTAAADQRGAPGAGSQALQQP